MAYSSPRLDVSTRSPRLPSSSSPSGCVIGNARPRSYALTLVYFEVEQIDRQRLAQLWTLLDAMLATYESGAPELGDILEHRREQALDDVGDNPLARRRINTGPMAWLLSAPPETLARQALEIYPVPEPRDVRVFVMPDESTVDVVCRDRTGLLAAVTAALESLGFDIAQRHRGNLAGRTWRCPRSASQIARSLWTPMSSETGSRLPRHARRDASVDGVVVTADNEASPWYTILTVEADDRPGLLHAITAAIARGGGTIHSARVATTPVGRALDTFELSDAVGAKLADDRITAIESFIRTGARPLGNSRRGTFLRKARGEW